MKTILPAIVVAILVASVPRAAHAVGTNEYQAFWLVRDEKGNEYVDLVLSRVPLQDLMGAAATGNLTVLDCDTVVLTTYAKDSVWNIDRQPIKVLRRIDQIEEASITIAGQVFTWTKADLKDVVRILENPEGKIPIHRSYAPAAGQEAEIKELAGRLRRQIKAEANQVLEDTTRKLADPQH